MIKVYIASPYSEGDSAKNVRKQIDTADKLMDYGFVPFWPLHGHFNHLVHPRPYEEWIKVGLEWVKACDCLLRLNGVSAGADKEVSLAKSEDIPVFYSINELIEHYNGSI